jgi:hypothetical protein
VPMNMLACRRMAAHPRSKTSRAKGAADVDISPGWEVNLAESSHFNGDSGVQLQEQGVGAWSSRQDWEWNGAHSTCEYSGGSARCQSLVHRVSPWYNLQREPLLGKGELQL